ncbi:membrane metallo-endopeptidase-like 1 [Rhipicephalus sanguineus]|uniref:membrane metallo-endopeptidase-like 1 n=1 Tax=Rhipicephalus sanguineus TaxID=34632 RepID=UPI0020C436FC|nr:membrane metallo-endopeptidase-like 1 [Rhipicephalus sanguineus]
MAASDTAIHRATPDNQPVGHAQATSGDAEVGDTEASEERQGPAPVAGPEQPQEGQQPGDDAVLTRSVRTLAWFWGLLPGMLAGAAIAYLEWSKMKDDVAEQCNTSDCLYATELLKSALDRSFKPCDDFYSFVCSRYTGPQYTVLASLTVYMREVTEALLYTINVPPSHQNSTQKAAGLFRACVSMANTSRSEVSSLKKFLNLIGLDMSNMPPDPKFSIAERIVRLNLEYGFPTVVHFGFIVAKAVEKKILDVRLTPI